jgi:hypothetical protein
MRHNSMTVGTSPVKVPLGKADVAVVINNGQTNIYVGNTNGVSVNNGFPLGPYIGYEFERTLLDAGWEAVWVVSDAPGGQLRYGTVG